MSGHLKAHKEGTLYFCSHGGRLGRFIQAERNAEMIPPHQLAPC
jgi:hypothetical protein